VEAQKEKLEAEGHTIIQKGRKNIRYYVKDYENMLFPYKTMIKLCYSGCSVQKIVLNCFTSSSSESTFFPVIQLRST